MRNPLKAKARVGRIPTDHEIVDWLKHHDIPDPGAHVAHFRDCFEFAVELQDGLVPKPPNPGKSNSLYKAIKRLKQGLTEFAEDEEAIEQLRATIDANAKLRGKQGRGRQRDQARYNLFENLQQAWHSLTESPVSRWNRNGTSKGATFIVDGMALAGCEESFMTICDWHNSSLTDAEA